MYRPACVLIAALTAPLLSALPAHAASGPPDGTPRQSVTSVSGDVSWRQCTMSGGLVIVSVQGDSDEAELFRSCRGGFQDGKPVA
ncbi:hypothetical protein GCM10010145_20870 [Streptomyces ruber]|uniref:Secreted protein n=2 Tax=Streptomyces TaxID=1883 RepID=A0A918BBZ7_9ACTN|nr:hypothetical protein [Streptomyces ruber]GGQ51433.1 hypothetical protein GCM10010145_20870 [Streptomyces ruber]